MKKMNDPYPEVLVFIKFYQRAINTMLSLRRVYHDGLELLPRRIVMRFSIALEASSRLDLLHDCQRTFMAEYKNNNLSLFENGVHLYECTVNYTRGDFTASFLIGREYPLRHLVACLPHDKKLQDFWEYLTGFKEGR